MLKICSNKKTIENFSRIFSFCRNGVKRGFVNSNQKINTKYPTETITYDDSFWFPSETGPIQNSIYSDKIILPKCRLDQHIWENYKQWQDNTAVVNKGFKNKFHFYRKKRKKN